MVTHNNSIQLDRRWLRRFANTAFVVFLAGLALWSYWRYYMYTPWTRDGRVRAETVNIAPEVAGFAAFALAALGMVGGTFLRPSQPAETAP